MKTIKRQVGDLGEDIAVRYLLARSYQIIERNFWRPWGEIDIVAQNKGDMVFVEVKTLNQRADRSYVPEQNVSWQKQRKLVRVCQLYLAQKKYPPNTAWQIDVIAVELNWQTHRANLRHLKNAVWN